MLFLDGGLLARVWLSQLEAPDELAAYKVAMRRELRSTRCDYVTYGGVKAGYKYAVRHGYIPEEYRNPSYIRAEAEE